MDFKRQISMYAPKMVDRLSTLVSYNSVQGEPEEGAPFGPVVKACLTKALQMAEDDGFEVKDLDGYCGYAQMGEGDQIIGILAHLDVVPAGEGWDTDPFKTVIKDGRIYGRGVSDDKGAVVASLCAMKIVRDSGIPLNKRVRLIMGCNEESGSKCLAHYVETEGHIDMGFTPDGCFPGVHGEKGMVGATFSSKKTNIIDINGGVAPNVVCNHCVTTVPAKSFSKRILENYFNNENITYEITEDEEKAVLDVRGVAAHASTPHLGVNAISHTMVGLKTAGFQDAFVDFYVSHLGLETDGESLGCKLQDEYGALTLNNGMIFMKDGVITGTIDIRFPVTLSSKKVISGMKLEDEGGLITIHRTGEPLFFPVDSPLVSKLLKSYRKITGDMESQPITMGGGTYAKGIHNCIAFGCEFPKGEDKHIHDANEWADLHELELQVAIYVEAIMALLED